MVSIEKWYIIGRKKYLGSSRKEKLNIIPDEYEDLVKENERLLLENKILKKAKYSSYKGEISPESENLIKRDFKANEPYSKSLTDITEFSLCDGKVYLSPLIDCFIGLPITYTIGKSPNTELTNTMLDNAHKIIGDAIKDVIK